MTRLLAVLVLMLGAMADAYAQFTPGTLYREYIWTTPDTADEAFLRVGGRYGYKAQVGKLPEGWQRGEWLKLRDSVDLSSAIRAEVTIERVQSHEDSRNLRISLNGADPLFFGDPVSLPDSADEYMFHTDQTVEIPLVQLKPGKENFFRFELDTVQRWNWPQNLLYAVIFRVYYAPQKSLLAPPVIDYPHERVPLESYVSIKADTNFVEADYAVLARDTDWSGRGVYRRLHWQTLRGKGNRHLGSSVRSPDFPVRWQTEWLPDQRLPMELVVRAKDKGGIYHVSAALGNLRQVKRPYSLALITPSEVPKNWVTRSGVFSENVEISLDPARSIAYQLAWTSWSPCYANGVYLNDHLIWIREGDCYVYATHQPVFTGEDLIFLQKGNNTIKTGRTPLINGQMVHGMEVQWPGIVMKLKYQ